MKNEIEEVLSYREVITIIEWSDIVHDVLPKDRLTLRLKYLDNNKRELTFSYPDQYNYLFN
jgi:tRNA A37 threonylcarbamoyladenosine biosynthesis protein TsaE